MVYLVVSNTFVKKAYVLKEDDEFAVVCLEDGGRRRKVSGIRVRRNRLFATKEEAEAHVGNRSLMETLSWSRTDPDKPKPAGVPPATQQKTHHDYEMDYFEEMIRRGGRRVYGI